MIRLTDQAEDDFLASYFAVAALSGGHTFRLYTNDVTAGLTQAQVEALVAADFDEATFAGYSAVTRSGGWTIAQGDPTSATNTACEFTRSTTGTPQNIYGYYVLRVETGDVAWFEPFAAPVVIENAAETVSVTPTLTLDDRKGNGMAIGDIIMSGRATAAAGRLKCDGSAVSRSTYADLFAEIGTEYGAGDGTTTFNLPDYRGAFPLGVAASGTGSTLGDTGGSIDHVHDLDTSTSAAAFRWPASSAPIVMRRRTSMATTWDANLESTTSYAGSASSDTGIASGIALTGDTDTANPPYTTCNYEIVYA